MLETILANHMPLLLVAGVLWTATYLLIIRRGFQDRTYGMPLVALCANVSWEFIFSFLYPHVAPQVYVNYLWLALDLVILAQFFHYGRKEFPESISALFFYVTSILALSVAFLLLFFLTMEFGDWNGRSAFATNLIMSILFVAMLLQRNSLRGQSLYIALCKMLGTITACLVFFADKPGSWLFNTLFLAILIFDLQYVFLIYRKCREEGINPWTRF